MQGGVRPHAARRRHPRHGRQSPSFVCFAWFQMIVAGYQNIVRVATYLFFDRKTCKEVYGLMQCNAVTRATVAPHPHPAAPPEPPGCTTHALNMYAEVGRTQRMIGAVTLGR